MEVKLTQEEAKNVIAIINRTTFQGQEAEAVVMLKQRILSQLQQKKDLINEVKKK